MNIKITILTPTFNDAVLIPKMIESVLKQNYKSWELLIADDGSTDKTAEIVLPFLGDKIKYFRSEQDMDQLNALYKIVPYIAGDIVMLLHSDDMLSDPDALLRIATHFHQNKMSEGVYADLLTINSNGLLMGSWKSPNILNNLIIVKAFLLLGSNIIYDFFCVRKNVFFSNVLSNYILWNTFYWIKLGNGNPSILKLHKIDPYYKYRWGSGNYLSQPNEARKAFVLSGCYRTIVELSYYYGLKNSLIFRAISGIPKGHYFVRKLSRFFYFKTDGSFSSLLLSLKNNLVLLRKLIGVYNLHTPEILKFFVAPMRLIENFENNQELLNVNFENINQGDLFFGKDSRILFERIIKGEEVPYIYTLLIERAQYLKAFRVPSEHQVEIARNILRFLCLPLPILVADEETSEDCLIRGFKRRFEWSNKLFNHNEK